MLKKFLMVSLLALFAMAPSYAQVVGSVDYHKVVTNYSKAKAAYLELDDRASELQTYLLKKEKEFKKIESPIQRRTFEEKTAKEFAQKQEAYAKFKVQKEEAIDRDIQNAIKTVAMENKVNVVVDSQAVFFGNIDLTDKVIKKLNLGTSK